MILGTVELGLDYGINNYSGKPSYQQAFELLDTAWNEGIRELDTAAAYGDSEKIIGNYQETTGHSFLIDTKLPVSIGQGQYDDCLNAAYDRLHVETIHLLYLHSFAQCRDDMLLDFLRSQKENKKIEHIGISIYEPEELQYIIDSLPFVDTIQFPFSILDSHRWIGNGLLNKAKDTKKRLYVRSVFLQGLMFKSESDEFIKSIGAEKYIEAIGRIAVNNGFSIAEMAYKYVIQMPEIDDVIIGCQNANDVMMNMAINNSEKRLNREAIDKIDNISSIITNIIIDPRKWKRA